MCTPAGIIFDMDGLMFDTERLSSQCWTTLGQEINMDIPESLLARLRGLTRPEHRAEFIRYFDGQVDYDDIIARHQKLFWSFVGKSGLPVKPGLTELLTFLKEKSIPTAMATASNSERAGQYLDLTGLRPFFQHLIFGDQASKGKPDPELFLLAASQLHASPKNCIVLEDSINGVQAGLAGGFQTIMIPDLTQPYPELEKKLCAKFDTLFQVISYLEDQYN